MRIGRCHGRPGPGAAKCRGLELMAHLQNADASPTGIIEPKIQLQNRLLHMPQAAVLRIRIAAATVAVTTAAAAHSTVTVTVTIGRWQASSQV